MCLPKVSVIMPSLNVAPYIRECIESAINQTLKEIEIICVDAGSTDGTLEILREYAEKDNRIKVIISDKKSYGYQMNLGLDAASGEYMGVLETDDVIKSNMFEVLYTKAKKNNVDFIKSDYEIFVRDGADREFTYRSIAPSRDMYYKVFDPAQHLEIFNVAMMTWTGIYNIDFLRKNKIRHNESPGASYQDNGFWFQTFMYAKRVYFIDRAFYMLRRDNPNSSVHNRAKVFCIFEEYAFIEAILRSNPAKEAIFSCIFQKKKFDNCQFHYNRVGDEFKMEFLRRMSDEFKEARSKNELNEKLFFGSGFLTLTEIMDHPDRFHLKKMLEKKDWKPKTDKEELEVLKLKLQEKDRELQDIQTSLSFRIGKIITFIPRKIRAVIQCIREFGIRFTIRKILVALHIVPDEQSEQEVDYKKMLKKNQSNQAVVRDYNWWSTLPEERYEEELKAWFKRKTKRELNLENPVTFNEKIQWLKLYDNTPLKTQLSDKYLVREWIKEKIGEKYLIKLLGVWDNFDDIDFAALPAQFVLKANHGCGWNIIVRDKNAFDIAEAKQKFDNWMSRKFTFMNGLELQYLHIEPKIIAEEYIENDNQDLFDYKVFCFNGKAENVMFLSNRSNGLQMAFYDTQWNKLPFTYNYPRNEHDVPKPPCLQELIMLSEKLAGGFPHVRVDFYVLNDGSIKFGEMTFTSASGACNWNPPEQNEIFGNMIELPKRPLEK